MLTALIISVKLKIGPINGITSGCEFNIAHHTGSSNGPDVTDIGYSFGSMTPALDIYEEVSGYPWDELSQDGKRDDNMDTINSRIDGRGLSSPVESEIEADISQFVGEDNMDDKKVIGRVYDANSTADPNDDILLGTYDCWNMTESGQKVYLTVKDGISHRWATSFYDTNIADFNNDGKVNFVDFAMLANDFGKPIGNYLTDISGSSGSDGFVDYYDLAELADNWLAE